MNLNCKVGGPYQRGALVLVQGNVSNSTMPLNSQQVNVTVFNGSIVRFETLTTASDGSYETSFSNLSVGSYDLNITTSYKSLTVNCSNSFIIGSSASFVLNKLAQIYNLNSNEITYNITLKLINTGSTDSLNTNITDSDSNNSPYTIGTLSSVYQTSYLKNFTREDTIKYVNLVEATALGIDPFNNSLISSNSTSINITIPPTTVGKQIVITKNIEYISETNLNVTYNVSSTLYNSGDEDLINIIYIDTDIQSTAILLNLTKGDSTLFSNLVIIDKAASNTQHQFALGSAVINSLTFYSNRPNINVPGYGGPADVIVYAPSIVNSSENFDSIIEVKNINPDIGQDFIVDYWITNKLENTNYSSGQQTIFISANSSTNITISLTAPSNNGNYRLKASVSWIVGTASSFDSFIVEGEDPESGSGGGIGGGRGSGGIFEKEKNESEIEEIEELKEIEEPPIEHEIPEPEEEKDRKGFTGFSFRNLEDIKFSLRSFIILLAFIVIFILIYRYLTRAIHKREKHLFRLKAVKGLRVFTTNGFFIGKIHGAFIEDNKIYGLKIKLHNKKKFKYKNIVLKYKHVQGLSDIAIVDEEVLEEIQNDRKKRGI